MKEPIIIPFLFLLAFLCTAVVFAALDMMAVWGYTSAGTAFTLAFALRRLPASLLESIIPATITAIVITGLRMVRKPISRFLGLLLCLGASYLVMVNGMIWLKGASSTWARPTPQTAASYLKPGEIRRMNGSLITAREVAAGGASGVMVFTESRPAGSRMAVYPRASVVETGGKLSLALAGAGPAVLTDPAASVVESVFTPDALTASLLRDVSTLTSDFKALLADSLGDFFVASLSLLFLCTASLAILRVTRWPMINVVLLAVALRAVILFYHFLSTTVRPEVSKVIADPLVVRLFPSIILAIIGVIFLLVDILFIPADRYRQVEAL